MSDTIKQAVEKAQTGDESGFDELFEAFHDRVVAYAFRRVLDADSADDIAGIVFMKVIKGLPRFVWKHEHSFSGWIFRIASNEVNQYLRKSGRYKNVDSAEFDLVMPDLDRSQQEQKSVESTLDAHKNYILLNSAISQMKPKQQDLIHMYYFEHLTHEEIAEALSMRNGAVRVAIHRAVDALRKQLASEPALQKVLQERMTS